MDKREEAYTEVSFDFRQWSTIHSSLYRAPLAVPACAETHGKFYELATQNFQSPSYRLGSSDCVPKNIP